MMACWTQTMNGGIWKIILILPLGSVPILEPSQSTVWVLSNLCPLGLLVFPGFSGVREQSPIAGFSRMMASEDKWHMKARLSKQLANDNHLQTLRRVPNLWGNSIRFPYGWWICIHVFMLWSSILLCNYICMYHKSGQIITTSLRPHSNHC